MQKSRYETVVHKKETVDFYCDKCGKLIGSSVVFDDGYVEEQGEKSMIIRDDGYGDLKKYEGTICEWCWNELCGQIMEFADELFSFLPKNNEKCDD